MINKSNHNMIIKLKPLLSESKFNFKKRKSFRS
jgi:hypothetical protein